MSSFFYKSDMVNQLASGALLFPLAKEKLILNAVV